MSKAEHPEPLRDVVIGLADDGAHLFWSVRVEDGDRGAHATEDVDF